MNELQTDVVIIGAGPVGIFAVFQCGMLDLKCHVIDALGQIGGQCQALYHEKPIYDIPAIPVISGENLIKQLEQQALPFAPTYHLNQEVTDLQSLDDGFRVVTSKGTSIYAKAVLIATGGGALGPNRPPLENIKEFEGQSVFYHVKKMRDFEGKNVVIAGGGDAAVDWAAHLPEVAKKVYIVHRRAKFRAAPANLKRMDKWVEQGKLELVTPFQLHGLQGEGGVLEAVCVRDFDNNIRTIPAHSLLCFFGLSAHIGPYEKWGINLQNGHILVEPHTQQTNRKGIYAIGDIAHYQGKLKLILQGFSEAAVGATAIKKYLNPTHLHHFEYSTTKGIPKI